MDDLVALLLLQQQLGADAEFDLYSLYGADPEKTLSG